MSIGTEYSQFEVVDKEEIRLQQSWGVIQHDSRSINPG